MRVAVLAVAVWMFTATVAFADSVRVTRDKTTIWRADAPSVTLTVVRAGTVLEVIERQGVWIKVRLPATAGDPNVLGLVLASSVEPIGGTTKPSTPPARQPGRPGTVRRPNEKLQIRGFGELGYMKLAASKSFNAIFDRDYAVLPGAGVDAILPNQSFASFEFEWFRLTGERVFVNSGQVFPLGIKDVVTIAPITATFGYHFGRSLVARPYAGAGFGAYVFKEKSDFAQSGDDVSDSFGSFHVLGGVDLMRRSRISTAIEGRYTSVRKSIGADGASASFNETNLGGFTIRMKVVVH